MDGDTPRQEVLRRGVRGVAIRAEPTDSTWRRIRRSEMLSPDNRSRASEAIEKLLRLLPAQTIIWISLGVTVALAGNPIRPATGKKRPPTIAAVESGFVIANLTA